MFTLVAARMYCLNHSSLSVIGNTHVIGTYFCVNHIFVQCYKKIPTLQDASYLRTILYVQSYNSYLNIQIFAIIILVSFYYFHFIRKSFKFIFLSHEKPVMSGCTDTNY